MARMWDETQGSEELPDNCPQNAIESDLKLHAEYLRKHIDKKCVVSILLVDVGGTDQTFFRWVGIR